MKTYLFTIILFCVCYIHSATAQDARFFDYYRNTNLAELAICDSDFVKATEYYKAAFKANPDKPFYKDLGNAFFAAMGSSDYHLADGYMAKLLHKGLDSDFISFLRRPFKDDDLKRVNVMLKNHPNTQVKNTELIKKLRKMYRWDQGVRAYFAELYDGAYMVDSTYAADSANASELMNIFKKYGLLSETIDRATHFSIIILHNGGAAFGGRPAHIFDTLLYRAALSFDYDMRKFADGVQNGATRTYFQYGDVKVDFPIGLGGAYYKNKIYPNYYDDSSENVVNKNRAKLGLETLDELRKKIATANRSKDSIGDAYAGGVTDGMVVLDLQTEADLKNWLSINSKEAPVKKSLRTSKFVTAKAAPFEIGVIDKCYKISESTIDDAEKQLKDMQWYNCGKVSYGRWYGKRPAPLPWNYVAEVIENPKEDLTKDSDRYDKALFIPGYRMFIQHGWNIWITHFVNITQLYDSNQLLIHFSAFTDTGFYKIMLRKFGAPYKITAKKDTVNYPLDKRYVVILKTKTYTWKKGSIESEFVLKDIMNSKGKKVTVGQYFMRDADKYNIYLQKVEEEKKQLDKLYATTKN